jgi:hypothetical protein
MTAHSNALYAGKGTIAAEHLMTVEGAHIKHPALINKYATPKSGAIGRSERIKLIGVDIETDHTTGKPMLLGTWRDEQYNGFHAGQMNLFDALVQLIDQANADGSSLACWRKFDGYALIRILVEHPNVLLNDPRVLFSRLDKIEGKPGKEPLTWKVLRCSSFSGALVFASRLPYGSTTSKAFTRAV